MRETRSLELVALDRPHTGAIAARLADEPELTHVQDVADALMVALDRGVDLVVPRRIFDARRGDFPQELPPYVRVV